MSRRRDRDRRSRGRARAAEAREQKARAHAAWLLAVAEGRAVGLRRTYCHRSRGTAIRFMIDETATFYVPGKEPVSAEAAREQLFGLAISDRASKPGAPS